MAYLVGAFVGGLIAIYLLAALWEWALFKRILDDPLKGKMLSVGAAWLSGSTLAGFGGADGGPYYWAAFVVYLPATLTLAFFAYRRGVRLRQHQPAEVAEAFN